MQKHRFHLILGMCFGPIAAVTSWLLIQLLIRSSSRSLVAFLAPILATIHVIPAFIGLTLIGSELIYWVLVLGQWFIVGFGISFLFRSRHWFFNSTFPFWLLFPLTFVPLILESSGMKYLCGFGLGQPWEWMYYCENYGVQFFSVTAFWEDLSVGLVGVILMWQFARSLFGQREP